MSQSTNDVFPTAMRMATLMLLGVLTPRLQNLVSALDEKGDEFSDVIKSGRTHLADAVPVTLGQEFKAYAAAMRRATRLLTDASEELFDLGIGGTATGTGINTPLGYRHAVIRHLNESASLQLRAAEDLREPMQSQLPVVAVSAALRNLALELTASPSSPLGLGAPDRPSDQLAGGAAGSSIIP